MRLIDSHSHIDADEFAPDRAAVIERARLAGVTQQIVPAITAASWPALREICATTPGLHPAYGLHPMFLAQHQPQHLQQLETWLATERPVAVGECGLDFFIDGLDPQQQRFYFQRQLELAKEFDLPLILHARRALAEVIYALRGIGGLRGVVHSFSGSAEQARELFKLGFHLGIGGPLTYERATRLRGIVATMPIEFLLLETDSPDQPLSTHRGQRNEPGYLTEVCDCVAELRKTDAEIIAQATTANAIRLFGLDPATD
ncbi:TatD family deoxyribonuclease [Pseudolysobacter antarcticus]|uniref:TatD family deoxyribonuclease n=1 Tax=Pseudolysobacter antarcticus TaxID=2511995 RepID=A0A411HIZ8_9GAMM|nr:TatD family hydrolase [Pseudolysobacter antarcticus]QBB70370.1 TatD family deoxyribonuclease [Pseudolysobacter antarcticus]